MTDIKDYNLPVQDVKDHPMRHVLPTEHEDGMGLGWEMDAFNRYKDQVK
jgi:hypothetical protein